MKKEYKISPFNILAITVGVAIYSFGFVNFNMVNDLSEGGMSGVTLITHALFDFNPAYTSILLNIPLLFLGAKFFGRVALVLTVYGTVMLSVFMDIFQRLPFRVNIENDLLIAGLCAGLCAGLGLGLVFRYGGTTGGSDIVARLLEKRFGIQVGHSLFIIDSLVLIISLLVYIDLRHMVYTLIATFVMGQVINLIENGGYSIRGMLIITSKPNEVAETILYEINRGATFLKAEGAYSKEEKDMLYVVLTPQELNYIKHVLSHVDPHAFISTINVHDVSGEGFTLALQNKQKLKWKGTKK